MKNIKKIIYNPSSLVGLWLIYLFSPLVSVVRYLYIVKTENTPTLIRLILSSARHLSKFLIFALFLMVLIVWIKKYFLATLSVKHRLSLVFVGATALIHNFISRQLITLNRANYANYLYSHTGIQIEELKIMMAINTLVIVTIFAFLPSTYKLPKYSKNYKGKIADIRLTIALVGLFLLILQSAFLLTNFGEFHDRSLDTYEEKFGEQYIFLPPLIESSPSDSKVIHPPQGSKWPAIGNQPVIRYFLYPRILISGVLMNNQNFASEIPNAYFVEVDPGKEETRWPIIDEGSKTIMFDEKTKITYSTLEIALSKDEIKVYKISF